MEDESKDKDSENKAVNHNEEPAEPAQEHHPPIETTPADDEHVIMRYLEE